MSPFTPPVLEWHQPEDVYRHLDWLTESQALDWMSRIAGREVDIYCLLVMVDAHICDAFMDCRALKGFTYPSAGEHEHREVYGLGICQVMNALHTEGSPIFLTGPALHVDNVYDYKEIKPKRSWWIDAPKSFDLLFKPSEIEQAGGMIEPDGGWSDQKQIDELKLNPLKEFSPERSGAELALLLSRLEISIDNQHDRIRYCVSFEDGGILAELGSDLKPLGTVAASDSSQNGERASTDYSPHNEEAYEAELSRLNALVATQTKLLESLQQFNEAEFPETLIGTTFPYSTKGLEALRAVALKHWAGYTPDKRQPTQKDIGYAICEELGLEYQKTNEPPRKAKELATLIRPDELPDA
jgi:hypothetical protein